FTNMVDGRAHRPFVYRVLVPSGISLLSSAIPDFIKQTIIEKTGDTRFVKKLGWKADRLPDYVIAVVIFWGCFVGFALTLRSLIVLYYPGQSLLSEFAPMLALIILPVFFRYYNHVYDPASLLLFAVAFLLLTRKSLTWYYLTFLLAAFNKETAVLLIPFFYLAFRDTLPLPRLISHSGLQLVLYSSIKLALTYLFSGNAGSIVEFHLGYNVSILTEPGRLLYIIMLYGVFAFLILHRWHEKPLLLRSGLIATLGPLVLLTLLFGNLDEPRQLYEAISFVFLLSLPTLMEPFGVDLYKKRNVQSG
ncbi:MAG: hypothetical protein MN733_20530, partial [Nitrososphaera sp.]|nr:hypothetical protein [Nitrososphaera sp.]